MKHILLVLSIILVFSTAASRNIPAHAQEDANACMGDLEKDGNVNMTDVMRFILNVWQYSKHPELDVNRDQKISIMDFAVVVKETAQQCTYVYEPPETDIFGLPE